MHSVYVAGAGLQAGRSTALASPQQVFHRNPDLLYNWCPAIRYETHHATTAELNNRAA